MDDLSVSLNSSNIRGRIESIFLSHLFYADDLCLLSLSSAGMQKILGICSKYTIDHSLTYNANNFFVFCPETLRFGRLQLYVDNLLIPNVSECQYSGTIICQKTEIWIFFYGYNFYYIEKFTKTQKKVNCIHKIDTLSSYTIKYIQGCRL